ncbi:MAG TPA: long-chain fatty acid--CoA ligase [Pyrinomonadaceae bacterium]|jgi:long-chain acyl-CoA synthetase|nr:long-chain fatty acid--CoA ligase [Pyrinomonadaceae bacterium]
MTQTNARAAEFTPAAPSNGLEEPKTLVEVVARAMRVHARPDTLNVKRGGQWRAVSSEEFTRRARHIALGLYASGLRRGDRAAILSESSPEWVLTDLGCLSAGVVNVPLYPTLAPQQVCYILNDSGAVALFVQHREAYARIRQAAAECPALRSVILLTGDAGGEEGLTTLEELEAAGRALEAERPALADQLAAQVRPDDLATIIYTSGTTGEPKGVMLTHSNVVSNLLATSERLAFNPRDVILSVLPLSHIFERGAMFMYLHHGARVYFAEAIEKIGDNMREVRPTLVVAVPRLYEKIYARIKEKAAAGGKLKAGLLAWAVGVGKHLARHRVERTPPPPLLGLQHRLATRLVFSKWKEATGGRVRLFTSGGAALPEELGYVFMGAGLPIVQGYGLTETSPVMCVNSAEDNRIGSVGRPIRGVEVRIAPDGEIETRGPNVMLGYYNKPEETRAVFTEDGWFKTGDVGSLDAEGYLRITDRKKELFKTSGGKYVAPQPIEQKIKESRFVNQVVLVGDGRKFPAALIVPDWEMLRSYAQHKGLGARSTAELCRHPRVLDLMQRQVDAHTEHLSRYERVKRVALLEKELTIEGGELTPTLKVKRRVIDDKYRDLINRLYADADSPPDRQT